MQDLRSAIEEKNIEAIKEVGYTVTQARHAGYACADARAVGYIDDINDAQQAGYVEGLQAAGYSCADAKAAGCSLQSIGSAGYTAQEMKSAGCETRLGIYTCAEAKAAGHTPQQCCAAGFSLEEGKAAGYSGGMRYPTQENWQHGTREGAAYPAATRW